MLTDVGGLRVKNRPMRVSHFFLAIDPARFLPRDQFEARMQMMRETVKSSRAAAGFDEVLIAGDPEWRSQEHRMREGVPISGGIWKELTALAERLNVAVPAASELK